MPETIEYLRWPVSQLGKRAIYKLTATMSVVFAAFVLANYYLFNSGHGLVDNFMGRIAFVMLLLAIAVTLVHLASRPLLFWGISVKRDWLILFYVIPTIIKREDVRRVFVEDGFLCVDRASTLNPRCRLDAALIAGNPKEITQAIAKWVDEA